VCCSVLQCVAVLCGNTKREERSTKERESGILSGSCNTLLQRVVACCSVLQCAAVCYTVLRHVLQHVAVRHVLQRVAVLYCSAKWHHCLAVPKERRDTPGKESLASWVATLCCSVLQCATVCCSVLQRVAVCCSALLKLSVAV